MNMKKNTAFLWATVAVFSGLASGIAQAEPASSDVPTYEGWHDIKTYSCDQTRAPSTDDRLKESYFRFEKRGGANIMQVIKPCWDSAAGRMTEKVFEVALSGEFPVFGFKFTVPFDDKGSYAEIQGQVSAAEIDPPRDLIRLFGLRNIHHKCGQYGCAETSWGANPIYLYPKGETDKKIPGCGLSGTIAERVADCATSAASETKGWKLITRTDLHPKKWLFPVEMWLAPDGTLHPSFVETIRESDLAKGTGCATTVARRFPTPYEGVAWGVPMLKLDPKVHSEIEEYVAIGAQSAIATLGRNTAYGGEYKELVVQSPNPFRCEQRDRWGSFVIWQPLESYQKAEFICNPDFIAGVRCLGRIK